jgi:hypothetical protein
MKRLVILLFLTGCASGPPLTEDEKEYNRQADWENWILCEQIYERAGQPTWHRRGLNSSPRSLGTEKKLEVLVSRTFVT